MSEESRNYGIQREYEPYRGPLPDLRPPGTGISPATERTWAMLAHLSIFLNLITGFLGPVAAGVIWLVYRDRSRTVATHALRSAVYQVVWLTALFIGWSITAALMQILIGFLLIPVMLLVSVVPFVFALMAAYEAYSGKSLHNHDHWTACAHRGYRSNRSTQYI